MLVPGGTTFGAGRIARLYGELGGAVTFIGKPYPAMYHMALDLVGGRSDMAVGIGDSVEHDIVGAKGVGAAAAFVLGGIHADEGDLDRLYERYGAWPDHVLERFAW
jgi:ribonucleotide monophosphatase NagD (HAD superfamily)